ncbi:MAG: response regulator, partial [Dehalococcoidia bacterium]|nr:response regulator [Dehalococcoidia bacterium]
ILHVEDDPDIRSIVDLLLASSAELVPAPNLGTARALLASGGRFDLVLLDLELPDGSGVDLLPVINAIAPSLPVVIFSAAEAPQQAARWIAASLVKSRTSNDQLVATIRAVINRGRGDRSDTPK